MKYDFCTLTDKTYVYRWLALCNSIDKFMPGSKIWVLCLDRETEDIIKKLKRANIETVTVSDLKDASTLGTLRGTRTKQEFAWTCKPAIMHHLLEKKEVEKMIFVDSDLLFSSSIDPLFEKYADASILITSHKFSEKKAYIADIVGYYNSGFIMWRNDEISLACVTKYKDQCIEWCHNYHDNGRHGDQSYLKTWPKEFKRVKEMDEKGVNLGTWNLERYRVRKTHDSFSIDSEPLICYHFHGLILYLSGKTSIRAYPITIHHTGIYGIYIKELQKAFDEIRTIDPSWEYGFAKKLSFLRIIKQYVTQKIRTLCLHTH